MRRKKLVESQAAYMYANKMDTNYSLFLFINLKIDENGF